MKKRVRCGQCSIVKLDRVVGMLAKRRSDESCRPPARRRLSRFDGQE